MRTIKVEVVVTVPDRVSADDLESALYDLLEPTYPSVYVSIPEWGAAL